MSCDVEDNESIVPRRVSEDLLLLNGVIKILNTPVILIREPFKVIDPVLPVHPIGHNCHHHGVDERSCCSHDECVGSVEYWAL